MSEVVSPREGMSATSPQPSVTPPQTLQRGPMAFYEANAFETLRTLWRKKLLLASFMAAGIVLALVGIAVSDKLYTANAVIQFDFARTDTGKLAPPSATMDAAVLVEGEAQIIRSAALARRVVTRLKLDKDPAYTSRGFLGHMLGALRRPAAGALALSNIDRAARQLSKQLTVTNNGRTYLITISVQSNTPEWSATLANAFLVEYVNDHVIQSLRDAAASSRSALADARATYGELHPSVIQAKASLAAAENRMRELEKIGVEPADALPRVTGQSFVRAEPEWLPSGPNPVAFLGMGILGSLLAGAAFVLFQERRDTGFRTEHDVPAETGIRCLGMIPRVADQFSGDRRMERREALRSLCLTAGLAGQSSKGRLAGQSKNSKIVMISSALPASGKSDFVRELSHSLVEEGSRVLVIDASPSSHTGTAIGLDDALDNSELLRGFFIDECDNSTSELRRKAGLNGAHNPFASFAYTGRTFEQLLNEAKTYYDVIIVDTPPVLLFADSIFLGRFADVSLLVADWNESPRATVAEAVNRLRENTVRVDGIVLTEVDLGQYPSFATGDRTYYLSKHQDAFHRPA